MYLGVVAVIGAAGGQFAGGLITKKWKLKVRGLLRFNFILLFIMLALDSIAWIRCDHDIAGVNVPYTQTYVYISMNVNHYLSCCRWTV